MTRKQGPGAALVAAILEEMAELDCVPDAKERALLETAARLADRLAALEAMVAKDGDRTVSAGGLVRLHPAIAEHRQQAIALGKVLAGIVVGDSSTARDPVKQRAAYVRWAARDRLVESQQRRARAGGA
jgi:hypothetical protein